MDLRVGGFGNTFLLRLKSPSKLHSEDKPRGKIQIKSIDIVGRQNPIQFTFSDETMALFSVDGARAIVRNHLEERNIVMSNPEREITNMREKLSDLERAIAAFN